MNRQKITQTSKKLLNCIGVLEPFLKDYSALLHGRGIKSQESQKNISNKLIYLYRAGILKQKQSGQLKNYYLNKDNALVYDLLVAAEESRAMTFLLMSYDMQELAMRLRQIAHKGYIIIFGSYARGDFSKNSDLDVLILGKYNKEKAEGCLEIFPFKVNIMHMEFSAFENGLFKKENFMLEVMKNHIIIKGSSEIVFLFGRFSYG